MSHTVSVRHTFETGHRLPHIGGKCQSLHGHSWGVEVTISSPRLNADGIIVNFSSLKGQLRRWVDGHLDHGLMLGVHDPLAEYLPEHGKVFVFGVENPDRGGQVPVDAYVIGEVQPDVTDLEWPTVENVAVLLSRVMMLLLPHCEPADGAYVSRVVVSETSVNQAEWLASPAATNTTVVNLALGDGAVVNVGEQLTEAVEASEDEGHGVDSGE
jgi:6-pyruvoyltetrahydropterin/6-carboxytetrahydropterin synthase